MILKLFAASAVACMIVSNASAADLPQAVKTQSVLGVSAPPFDPLQKPNSVYVFGGALSTGSLGSTELFNYDRPGIKYDNYIVGAAYNRDFYRLGLGFTLGAEIGIADRFGSYAICCNTVVKSSSVLNSGELWGGARISYDGFVVFDTLRIAGAATTGLSFTTDSIGREREREIAYKGSGRALFYFGPEVSFSMVARPDIELVYRVHHRSGGGGTLGNLREGYNANVIGIRYKF